MRYSHLLLDLDHTLLDTQASLVMAFGQSMAAAGADPADHYATFNDINQALWRKVEAQLLTPPQVHGLRFEQLNDQLNLGADPSAMADAFADGMGQYGELYEGAREVLDRLHKQATLALVTNGLGTIQRARIKRLNLEGYFSAVTISGEVGCAKPGTEIFDLTFAALGNPDRGSSLMVGDSLASDIRGGNAAGIDTCWYNPNGVAPDPQNPATHTITDLAELVSLAT